MHTSAGNRRFTFHEASRAHVQDHGYFGPIFASFKDADFMRSCFEHFATLEYSETAVMQPFNTAFKDERKLHDMSSALKFMNDFIFTDHENAHRSLKMPLSLTRPICGPRSWP